MQDKGLYSKLILLFCFAIMAYGNLVFYPRWKLPATQSNIAWDVEGYYWYLPSVFIFNDLKKQGFKDTILNRYKASGSEVFQHGFIHPGTGNYVMKYTSGMAVLYSPAFFIGHSFAKLLHYPQDGFSPPYKLSLQIWGLLFSFLGLFYLRKLLKLFYKDEIVALVLFLLVIGSNYFNYGSIDIGMSHTWLFTLYVFIILNSHYYYQSHKSKHLIRVGFLVGLVTLIRPTEIIAALIPALWGIDSINDIKARIKYIFEQWKTYAIATLCGIAVIFIQLAYWKYVANEWIVYSYQEQGFNFIRPHAFVYSWSYRSGWLRYSPMMILAFAGLLFYWKYGRNRFAVISFFILNYYIVSAWNIWDYGGFGGRAMIQSYPILLFPMTTFVCLAFRKRWMAWILTPFLVLFLYMNIWFTYQAHGGGLLDSMCTTKEYYWKIAGRWSVPEQYQKLKDTDELYEGLPEAETVIYNNTSQLCVNDTMHSTDPVLIASKNVTQKWLRVKADFFSPSKEWDTWQMAQLVVKFVHEGKDIKTRFIRVHRFLNDGETRQLFMDIKIPTDRFDLINISLYNVESRKQTCFSNIRISTFNEQN